MSIANRSFYESIYKNHDVYVKLHELYFKQFNWNERKYRNKEFLAGPNTLIYHPAPPGRPRFHTDLDLMPLDNRPLFHSYCRKLFGLAYLKQCRYCGTRKHSMNTFWSLNMNVCNICTTERTISDRTLFKKYGFDVFKPYEGSKNFFEACKFKVFFFVMNGSVRNKQRFTMDAVDFPSNDPKSEIVIFWREHLKKMGLDFTQLRQSKIAMEEAGVVLKTAAKRLFVHSNLKRIFSKYDSDRVVSSLRHNEVYHREYYSNLPFRIRNNFEVFHSARMYSDLLPEHYEKENSYAKIHKDSLPQPSSRF